MENSTGFVYRGGSLFCEDVSLADLARDYGTPAYVYSQNAVTSRLRAYREALAGVAHRICYAVKANSNLALLQVLAQEGAGFDIVSGGELFRVLAAGADTSKVVFSGVGKTREEIRFALERGIHSFNCESEPELETLGVTAAELGVTASIALRVNPDVDASTHPYISTGLKEHKFGIDIGEVERVYEQVRAHPNLVADGVSCHIGSQLLSIQPLLEAADKMLALVGRLRAKGFPIRHLDLGGGLGVPYRPSDTPSSIREFIRHLRHRIDSAGLEIMLEPGRSIAAEAGVLLARVLFTKQNGNKTFVILDAGMNDLIRPTLYQAHHEIVPVVVRPGRTIVADIVGPVCETGDFFARDREIPEPQPGDLVALRTAGAYGFVLASNYNSRPRSCELLVNAGAVHVARRRETYEDLVRGEALQSS
ncbi:MAG: diaminopimelate decarboxylase [Bryobacteraceae bacterium]